MFARLFSVALTKLDRYLFSSWGSASLRPAAAVTSPHEEKRIGVWAYRPRGK